MNFREFFRYEIGHKRTTRKIVVALGFALGIVAVGLMSWTAIDRLWISPGERNAARKALFQLDALQNQGVLSDIDFVARAKQIEGRVDAAEKAAWTTKDRSIVAKLMKYQSVISESQALPRKQIMAQQRELSLADPNWKQKWPPRSFGVATIGFDSRELHKELD